MKERQALIDILESSFSPLIRVCVWRRKAVKWMTKTAKDCQTLTKMTVPCRENKRSENRGNKDYVLNQRAPSLISFQHKGF